MTQNRDMVMSAINDGSKLVAQALACVSEYLELNDIDCDAILVDAKEKLEEALEKLAGKM